MFNRSNSLRLVGVILTLLFGIQGLGRAKNDKGAAALLVRAQTDAEPEPFPIPIRLNHGTKPVCALIATARFTATPLGERAVQAITQTVSQWSGVSLPLATSRNERPADEASIVLATIDDLEKLAGRPAGRAELAHIKAADAHAFAIIPAGKKVFVVSLSDRGVYNGAVYLRDFLIDGPRDGLTLKTASVFRAPALLGRPAYTLSIWGNEQDYKAADWNSAFQAFSRDGIDRVYFWVSGHFPSKKFPQTYKAENPPWDTTTNSQIGTIADLKTIIRHVHDSGMKFYLGGGMGGWVGTWLITNKKPGTMKTGPGETPYSLCPSHPESRAALTDYYVEMFDALPEADGMFIELADEFGECRCEMCAKPLDQFGSRQFGQSLLTLAKTIAEKIRSKHAHAKFAFTIGYDEHAHDPMFHALVKEMGDEHYEWMEARNRWEFNGPGGKDRPAAEFSRHVMKWKQWYNLPLETLVSEANRVGRSNFYGLITSFEPGYATGSFYKTIPFPTDLLPYVLTGFAYHEMSWEPTLTLAELKERARARFFGAEAPPQLTEDLWSLREVIRKSSAKGSPSAATRKELARISAAIDAAQPTASPKTKASLELMRKAVTDTQEYLQKKSTPPKKS